MQPRLDLAPYDYAAAARLRRDLGLHHVTAQVLVRRGFTTPDAASAFLAADTTHPLDAWPGLRETARGIVEHVRHNHRITIHGDYDCDGVCSTAILVRALHTLGAQVDWWLPSRLDDGYGLSARAVGQLAARGTRLLITADCAITAVEEVAQAKAAGLDVVVTDHHRPRADGALPDAPIVHPALDGYPCPELCATGVAYKLAAALLEAGGLDPALADEDLDLVAIATVADVVPLVGENRRLVRAGIRALAATRKPGLRALMAVAQVDTGTIDAQTIAFRLAPRINAAGRLRRADGALELLLTPDEERARAVAAELDQANSERRDVETRIRFEAEALANATPGAPAYVLAGEGWHPGVVGIVAARIAERHHRPAILIALDGDEGTGSGRSIPAFDLLAGMQAGSRHLMRFGGHRAAAGLSIARADVDAFRDAFLAHAASVLTPEDLVPVEHIDAIAQGDALGLGLAEELERLTPFGAGNPAVNLLVPSALLDDPRPMGEGRHVSFTLAAGGARSRAVLFGSGSQLPARPGQVIDAAVRLEANRWNGTVEPRLVLRHACPPTPAPIEIVDDPFAAGVLRELDRDLATPPAIPPVATRELNDVRGTGIAGLVTDLVHTREPVLVLAAHSEHRRHALRDRVGGFDVAAWHTFEDNPAIARGYAHVVALDPPPQRRLADLLERAPGDGWAHMAWGRQELDLTLRILEWELTLRPPLTSLYRALRAAQRATGDACEALLRGTATPLHSAPLAGRLVRLLSELGLAEVKRPLSLTVRAAYGKASLDDCPAQRHYLHQLHEGRAWLTSETASSRRAA